MWKQVPALISAIAILVGLSLLFGSTAFAQLGLPQESGPALTIPDGISGYISSETDVPIHFQGNGHAINALTFAVTFDPARLALNPSDVVFSLPAGFSGSAFLQPGVAGVLNLSVFSLSTVGLPDGAFVTLPFVASCPAGVGAQILADVGFSANPPATFGSVQGQDVPGSAAGNRLTIDCTGPPPDVNHPPQARDDVGASYEDRSAVLSVLANDQDVDGDVLIISAFTQPAHGRVTKSGSRLLYRPAANFFGADSFTYTASDGQGGSDTATVRITVLPVNDPPTAQADTATTDEDTPVTIPVLANDSDVDGDVLSVAYVEQILKGKATLEADGSIRFTPPANFNGQVRFRYVVQDGTIQAVASVTVQVNPVNDLPAALDDAAITQASEPVDVHVLANDNDVDGDRLAVIAVADPANGSAAVQNNGRVRYTPDAGFVGAERFTYSVGDGQGGQATGTVTVIVQHGTPGVFGVNARRDFRPVWEDSSVLVQVLANDSVGNGNPLQVLAVTRPEHGAVQMEGQAVRYTPIPDYFGWDAFSYIAGDGAAGAGTAEVRIYVIPRNDPPEAEDDAAIAQMVQWIDIPVLANDSDVDGDRLRVASLTQGSGGVVRRASSFLRYYPRGAFSGEDSFSYQVSDGRGGSATATVRVNVTPVNQRPSAEDDAVVTNEDTSVTIPVLANDSDPEGDFLTIVQVGGGRLGAVTSDGAQITYIPWEDRTGTDWFSYLISDGTNHARASVRVVIRPVPDPPQAQVDAFLLTGTGRSADADVAFDVLGNDVDGDGDVLQVLSLGQPDRGTAILNSDGTIGYKAPADFQGTATFTYAVAAVNNTAIVAEGVARLIAPQAGLVTAGDDGVTTPEDEPVVLDVLGNDVHNGGGELRILGFTPAHSGQVILQADGALRYSPKPDFNGQDSFTYIVGDGNLGAAQGQVNMTATPVNDPPQAAPDGATTDEDQAVVISVLTNDGDPEQDTLSLTQLTQPANGAVSDNGDGTVTYTPQADFFGDDSFSYTASDGQGGEAVAVVRVTVEPVGDAPDLGEDLGFVQEDEVVTIDVLANDFDPDVDELTVSAFTQPTQGVVTLAADGGLIYTPTHNFAGIDTFHYIASDGVHTATTAVEVTVNPVNDPPVAHSDVVTVSSSAPITFSVLGNDLDVDGDELLIESIAADGLHGQLDWDEDGLSYTAPQDFDGVDRFTYVVSDGVLTDTGVVEVRALMAAAALSLHSQSSGDVVVQPGQEVSYTLAVANVGRLALTNVSLQTQIPEGAVVVKSISSLKGRSGQPRVAGTELVWEVESLGLNQRLSVEVLLRTDGAHRGPLTIDAAFRSDQMPLQRAQPIVFQVGDPVEGQSGREIFLPALFGAEQPVGTGGAPTRVFLPRIGRAAVQGAAFDLPDLVIEQLTVAGGTVQVTLVNRGSRAVTNEFWVDVYIAPSAPPVRVNQIWSDLAGQGLVWGVTATALPIPPGGTLTLTVGDSYYSTIHSAFPGAPAPALPVYAQVDSFNPASSYGAVLESHEAADTSYNNIAGPVPAAVGSLTGPGSDAVSHARNGDSFTRLPNRPVP